MRTFVITSRRPTILNCWNTIAQEARQSRRAGPSARSRRFRSTRCGLRTHRAAGSPSGGGSTSCPRPADDADEAAGRDRQGDVGRHRGLLTDRRGHVPEFQHGAPLPGTGQRLLAVCDSQMTGCGATRSPHQCEIDEVSPFLEPTLETGSLQLSASNNAESRRLFRWVDCRSHAVPAAARLVGVLAPDASATSSASAAPAFHSLASHGTPSTASSSLRWWAALFASGLLCWRGFQDPRRGGALRNNAVSCPRKPAQGAEDGNKLTAVNSR